MFTLYAVWRLAAQLSLMQVDGAVWRGRWLWDVQRAIHLPSEVSVQHLVLPHPLLVQAANVYYAVAHVRAIPVPRLAVHLPPPALPEDTTRWPSPPGPAC